MATFTEFVEVDPLDAWHGPRIPCLADGMQSHEWKLTIENGQVTVGSGCRRCDEDLGDMEFEDLFMNTEITCKLKFNSEVYGWETPEYDFWMDLIPTEIGELDHG